MTNHRLLCLAVVVPVLLLVGRAPAASQSLSGSRASVSRMYRHAVDHGIYFYKTGQGLRNAASKGRLLRLSSTRDYAVSGVSYPFVRPTTRTFVERLGAQHRRACGERLVVTSAARPKSMRLNNSVARSVHPTGIAIDLRRPSNRRCRAWLRRTLLDLERAGVLEATEERRPPHFHVAVFPGPYAHYVQRRGGAVLAGGGAGEPYRVRRGDSLWEIARRHDTTVKRLKAANGLRSSTLRVGQTLVIPGR